jgi:hypothetical protein
MLPLCNSNGVVTAEVDVDEAAMSVRFPLYPPHADLSPHH